MSRPARFTQHDIIRAFRAAEKVERDVRVTIWPDGRIIIEPVAPVNSGEKMEPDAPKERNWVL